MTGQLSTLGPNAIETELGNQALSDLKLGGKLSEEDQRNADQTARAAFASRGLLYSSPSAAAEVVNRQQFADQRRTERRGFASGVNDAINNRKNADRSFAGSAYGELFSTLDPFQRVFAGYSKQGGTSGLLDSSLQGAQLQQSQDVFAQRLEFDRQQLAEEAKQAALTRQSNTKGSLIGGALGAFGNIFGGWLGGR